MSAVQRLHVVTDDTVLAGDAFPERAERVLEAGGAELALHVRGPRTGGRDLYDLAERLAEPARRSGAALVVNDRVDVALALDVSGVQLGARSLPIDAALRLLPARVWVGASVRDASAARGAAMRGAALVVLGSVWPTPSHPGRTPCGPGEVREATTAGVPVIGVGGVTDERIPELLAAGAHGGMVLRAVWDAPDPAEAVARLLDALEGRESRAAAARKAPA